MRRLLKGEVTGSADALWVPVRGNHCGTVEEETGPQHRPAGTTRQPRGAGRAYTAALAKVNTELAGVEGWSPLPERMEQLRRGVAAPRSTSCRRAPTPRRPPTSWAARRRPVAGSPPPRGPSHRDHRPRRPRRGPAHPGSTSTALREAVGGHRLAGMFTSFDST
ncbi:MULTISPECIES: hypothetical protein [Streptomyces]|uniref:Uncharacterized protein n=2 Tax=Streptomyces TaxID=1883 RepID=A0A124ECV8_9ACTN|nr:MULTISPECIES: hypothetical protein [Streptomyces]KUH38871.1 hypothetical protein ATE80_10660 [Streptomyces kanasensis]UUS29718.1 hypothetical protein NRO40_01970 [Streptomyces changanensis]